MKSLLPLLLVSVAIGANGPEAPALGYVRGASGHWARLSGVADALSVERADQLAGAGAVFWTGALLITEYPDAISVSDKNGGVRVRLRAGSAPLRVGSSVDGMRAVVYDGALQVYSDGVWTDLPVSFNGEVLALTLTGPEQLTAVIRSADLKIARFRLGDGAVQNEAKLDLAADSAVLFPSGAALLAKGRSLTLRQPSGDEQTAELPGEITSLSSIGPDWVQASLAGGLRWGIRVKPTLRVMELPELEP